MSRQNIKHARNRSNKKAKVVTHKPSKRTQHTNANCLAYRPQVGNPTAFRTQMMSSWMHDSMFNLVLVSTGLRAARKLPDVRPD